MNSFGKENDYNIKEAIVGAIAFFDMFDYPLADFEIWKFLLTPNNAKQRQTTLREVLYVLKKAMEIAETKSPIGDLVSCKNGLYFLKGRSAIVNTRLKRYIYADRKFKLAMRVAKIFRLIPWIKMIAVSNVIGAHNLKDGSDIDLFIIAANKKIWLTRFFCVGIAQALGLRPKKGNERDKICLNFYVSEEAMNIEGLMLKERREDIYFIYWLANLIPIYEVDNAYKKFIQANHWIRNYFPNWRPARMERRRYVRGRESKFNLLNLFNRFENQFKKLQLKLMPNNLKELMNKDTRVVVSDKVLKLHINDRRSEYKKNYELRIKNYE